MTDKLVAEEGPLKGLILDLEEGDEWVVGRDPDFCQLVVEDPATSRRHLICRRTKEGIVVENLSSTNPIAINDEQMAGPQLLINGDTIRIGSGIFRFFTEVPPPIVEGKPEEIVVETPGIVAVPPPEEEIIEKEEVVETEEEPHDTIFEEEEEEVPPAPEEELKFNLQAPGRWLLKVIAGPNNGAEFGMMPSHSYVVGTDATSCDIVFHDISVSRQHARLAVSDDEILTIEDLQSRNGTLIDGDTTEEKTQLAPNNLVTMGTTTFVVIDREAERETIVSPPLASFGKVVQDEATIQATQAAVQKVPHERIVAVEESPSTVEALERKTSHAVSGLLLLAIITGLFVIVGVGTSTLFRTEEVVAETVDVNKALSGVMADFPNIQYSFTKSTGTLLLLGHVSSGIDRSQLLYNLQGLPFITNIDDNIIIDEYVWQEANQVLAKNPKWRSVTIHSPQPGRFVMSGYLKTKTEAEQLAEYMGLNFPYPELLEKKVVVEEEVITLASSTLYEKKLLKVEASMTGGELSLSGSIGTDQVDNYREALNELRKIEGVRSIKSFVVEVAPQETYIDLSDVYEVSGYSNVGGVNLNVVINGRILAKGDNFDGYKITKISPGTIFLEKEGFKYKIDFKK